MKNPNIWDLTQKLCSLSVLCAEYSENSDIWCDFSKKAGNSPFCVQNINRFQHTCGGKTLKNWNFPQIITIFAKYLQSHMWFYKGIKVNISATTQEFNVALIYK